MPDDRARGCDISQNQDPAKLRLGDWRINPGLCFGFYRASIGQADDTQATAHGDALRGTGYVTGCYHALRGDVSLVDQARRFFGHQRTDNHLPPALDVERQELTRAMVLAFLDEWAKMGGPPLTQYTSKQSWDAIVKGPLPGDIQAMFVVGWFAGYPYDASAGQPAPMDPVSVALRSTPPTNRTVALPAPWSAFDIWQHSGKGSLPGYAKFIDLDVYNGTEAELRARFGGEPLPPDPTPPADHAAEIRAHAQAIIGLAV